MQEAKGLILEVQLKVKQKSVTGESEVRYPRT